MRKALVLAWWVVPTLLWACGSGLSSGDGDGGGKDGGHDGTVTVETGLPDSGTTEARPADGGGKDTMEEPAPCLPESTDDSAGVYVVLGGSTASNCGARSLPCASVALGLAAAASSAASISYIYVGPGTFVESTPLAMMNGVSIVGGWSISASTVWTHSCVPPLIQVTTPITANGLASPTTLDTLQIENTASATTPGGSIYGVMSVNSSLVLNDVDISVHASGGAGAAGDSATGTGGAGGMGCSVGNGDPGAVGEAGTPSGAGTFSSTGYAPANAVVATNTGLMGGTGASGKAAPTPKPVNGTKTTCVDDSDPPEILYLCDDAGGTYSISGAAGVPGCGGSGGPGGSGGSGGGCSIALYVWGGSVSISGGSLSSGNGGAGGPGGAGGMGGTGGGGTTGMAATDPYCDGVQVKSGAQTCKYPDASAGTTAGNGGNGGTGGQGGGGAGGCSYAYYAGGDAGVTAPSGVKVDPGTGGKGGPPNGATGPAAPHN
jgi:hypothetical protein